MKCHHCEVAFSPKSTDAYFDGSGSRVNSNEGGQWMVRFTVCPECHKPTLHLHTFTGHLPLFMTEGICVYPDGPSSRTANAEVPPEVAKDFNEAAAVLALSAQASAALSRRCLQHVLELAGFAHKDLGKAIEAAMASGMPSHLSDSLDAIRNIGNFAAHPTKDQNSGAIVPVEPAEAEWNLDVLELLFDFYFIQPAIALKRTEALNAKLAAAGKKPMKTTSKE